MLVGIFADIIFKMLKYSNLDVNKKIGVLNSVKLYTMMEEFSFDEAVNLLEKYNQNYFSEIRKNKKQVMEVAERLSKNMCDENSSGDIKKPM